MIARIRLNTSSQRTHRTSAILLLLAGCGTPATPDLDDHAVSQIAERLGPGSGGVDSGSLAEDYIWRNVAIVGGGYVPGIVFNTKEPGLVYARTDIGGAYRWNTKVERWVPLLDSIGWDDWNLTGVDSIATDPVDPNRVYVLAGTYTNGWTNQNGAVLRSNDRGKTWQRTDLPFKSGGNMPGRNMGERLNIDPNDDSILYLGARSGNGLWKSADYGQTWGRVASFPATGTYAQDPSDASGYLSDPLGVVWTVFDPASGDCGKSPSRAIYVGVADLGVSIYRSTDGGDTWQALPGQPTGFMPHHAVLASNGAMYIAYNNKGGPFDGESGDVWKYQTTTGTWTRITPGSTPEDTPFGYGGLAVDARHPDTVMVAALNSWWPDTILWRSTDAGATWSRIWDWGQYPNRVLHYSQDISAAPWLTFGLATDLPVLAPKVGWMVGDLEIDPFDSNRLLYGTGATIYGSKDLTRWDRGSPIGIEVEAMGIEETAVLDLVSPPEGAPLLSALGDLGGFRHDDLSVVPGSIFTDPIAATSTSLDFAEANPSIVARVGEVTPNGVPPAIGSAGISLDGGTTWSAMNVAPGRDGVVALSADGAKLLWSPLNAAVVYSTDHGATWLASIGIPAGARVASDRADTSRFYAFAYGTFFQSVDGGATFTPSAADGLPLYGAPAQFKAVPGHVGHIWLAGGAEWTAYGLWFSSDGGTTFTQLLNIDQADTIGFGRPAPGHDYPALYVSAKIGGVRGIYRSDDAGSSWLRVNDDQHQYGMTSASITGDPRVYGRVYVGTNGRGIVYGELGGRREGQRK
jgi:xyloglucan-specific exo-beta-1,4-glucanase